MILRRDVYRLAAASHVPMSPILVGPVHVVRGLADDDEAVTYELEYPELPLIRADWTPEMISYERWYLNRMRISDHGDQLAQILLRYNRAMDKADPNTRFLEFWGLLELLTGTDRSASYDRLVKRAAFPGSSSSYDRVILNYLRDHRNELAHRGTQSGFRENHVTQLKRFVERLIVFVFEYSTAFDNWRDLLGVLDGPTDRRRLAVRKKSLSVATTLAGGRLD